MTRFRSEIGWPFLVIYAVLFWRLGWPLVRALFTGAPVSGAPVVAATLALAFPVYLAATTRYVITQESLIVGCGPFRSTIALRAIQKLRASGSLLASPALSLNRIEVLASPGPYVLISPADRAVFLRELLARAPHVQLEGLEQP
jgi:hypothetical protein